MAPTRVDLVNHVVLVVLSLPADYPADQRPTILGGGLDDVYIFQQLHFHWGDDDTHGSEHTLNSIACGSPEIFM